MGKTSVLQQLKKLMYNLHLTACAPWLPHEDCDASCDLCITYPSFTGHAPATSAALCSQRMYLNTGGTRARDCGMGNYIYVHDWIV